MLSTVVFALKEQKDTASNQIKECLVQKGITVCEWEADHIELTNEMILLTDQAQLCEKAAQNGNYVIAYLTPENKGENFADAAYAVETLEGLDADYFLFVYARYHGTPLTILETKRCVVREIVVEDVETLYEIYKEPSITQYMEDLMLDREEERQYTRQYIKNIYGFYGYGMWIVIDKITGDIIGRAGLEHRDASGGVELGFMIAKPFQKKGLAYEVCKAILNYAKEVWEIAEVFAYVKEKNEPSISLCEKLGFRYQRRKTLSGEEYCEYKTPDVL